MDFDYTNELIEKIFLHKVLSDKKYTRYADRIESAIKGKKKDSDFRWFESNKNYEIIMKLVLAYFRKYDKIPNTNVTNALVKKYCEKNGLENTSIIESELFDVVSFTFDTDDKSVDFNIEKFAKEKSLYFAVSDNLAEITNHGSIDKCLSKFENVQKITLNEEDIGMNYFSKEGMDTQWNYLTNPESKIPTLWPGLDRYTNNGIPKDGKFLGLILAQSGLGKSLFLSNWVVNLLMQNLTVGVISLEMSENVYASRFTAHISKDNINRLKDTAKTSRYKIEEFYKKHPKANLYIKEYPPRSINSTDIDIYLEKLRDKGIKLDVLVVDYLNLLVPRLKKDSMYEDGLIVSEELRALSYKWGIPILSAVQANTEGMNSERIDMNNVSQSRGIVHTADFIAALYQKEEDRNVGMINMKIIKNRLGGQVGKIIQFKTNSENLVVSDISSGNEEYDDDTDVEIDESDSITQNLGQLSSDINDDL